LLIILSTDRSSTKDASKDMQWTIRISPTEFETVKENQGEDERYE
jgi:hypothetical protein